MNLFLEKFIVWRQFTFKLAKYSQKVNEAIVTNDWFPRFTKMPHHLGEP